MWLRFWAGVIQLTFFSSHDMNSARPLRLVCARMKKADIPNGVSSPAGWATRLYRVSRFTPVDLQRNRLLAEPFYGFRIQLLSMNSCHLRSYIFLAGAKCVQPRFDNWRNFHPLHTASPANSLFLLVGLAIFVIAALGAGDFCDFSNYFWVLVGLWRGEIADARGGLWFVNGKSRTVHNKLRILISIKIAKWTTGTCDE